MSIFAVNRTHSQLLKTQWIMDQLWILAQIPDCACLNVRILCPKSNLNHRSFFSLGRYVNEESSQCFFLFCFVNEAHLTQVRDFGIGIVLCFSHQACCLLYYLFEINTGIHIYQFTLKTFTLLLPDVGVIFRIWTKYWWINRFGEKKAHICRFAYYPYSPPSMSIAWLSSQLSTSSCSKVNTNVQHRILGWVC